MRSGGSCVPRMREPRGVAPPPTATHRNVLRHLVRVDPGRRRRHRAAVLAQACGAPLGGVVRTPPPLAGGWQRGAALIPLDTLQCHRRLSLLVHRPVRCLQRLGRLRGRARRGHHRVHQAHVQQPLHGPVRQLRPVAPRHSQLLVERRLGGAFEERGQGLRRVAARVKWRQRVLGKAEVSPAVVQAAAQAVVAPLRRRTKSPSSTTRRPARISGCTTRSKCPTSSPRLETLCALRWTTM